MKTAVVVPCYRVKAHILSVIEGIGPEVTGIFVVDDGCPEGTGAWVREQCRDARVRVVFNDPNRGVGGAVMRGYEEAVAQGFEIIVKIDGDNQMDARLIPLFTDPIEKGLADYSKGNRFYALESLAGMPRLRVIGNTVLSFVSKISSGYWNLMDPTNGFTAIHAEIVNLLPLHKIDPRYFFESDMLFRLGTVRAVIHEVPMQALYQGEQSQLSISHVSVTFPFKHLKRFFQRIFYNYFLRDFNVCSLQLIVGILMIAGGAIFGMHHWHLSTLRGIPATTGTVMLATLPIIIGVQLLIAAVSFDVMNIPQKPVHTLFLQSKKMRCSVPGQSLKRV